MTFELHLRTPYGRASQFGNDIHLTKISDILSEMTPVVDSHALLFTSIVATSTCIMIHKHLTIYNGFFGYNFKPCEVVLVVSVTSALVKSLSDGLDSNIQSSLS